MIYSPPLKRREYLFTHLDLRQQIELGTLQQRGATRGQLVLVLLEPILRRVLHRTCVMLDAELVIHPLGARCAKSRVLVALCVQVPRELVIIRFRHDALLVEEREYTGVLAIDEVEDVLIVGEGDEFPQDALPLVLWTTTK